MENSNDTNRGLSGDSCVPSRVVDELTSLPNEIKHVDIENVDQGGQETLTEGSGANSKDRGDHNIEAEPEEEEFTNDPGPNIHTKELRSRDHNVERKDDNKDFEMSGIAFIEGSRNFVICDHGNQVIKLVDEQYNVVSKLSSVFQPWSVVFVDADILLVSFPFVRLLQYLKVKGGSHILPWYPLVSGNEYHGLAYDKNKIIAICKFDGSRNVPSIHIIDRQGNIHASIYETEDGKLLFVDPGFIDVNRQTHVIYVSDQGSQSVLSMTVEGAILGKLTAPGFQPMGISVDSSSGTVFVCDTESESILILNSELHMMQRVVAKQEVMQRPLALRFCDKTERLIVTMENKSFLRMFKI